MKPHFLLSSAELKSREQITGEPIRDDPDSSGYYGKILKEGLKEEHIKIEITLVSSGNTAKISNDMILNYIMDHLGKIG